MVLFICSTTRTRSFIYIIIVLGIVKKDFLFISRDDSANKWKTFSNVYLALVRDFIPPPPLTTSPPPLLRSGGMHFDRAKTNGYGDAVTISSSPPTTQYMPI